jgi:hypothetical protein
MLVGFFGGGARSISPHSRDAFIEPGGWDLFPGGLERTPQAIFVDAYRSLLFGVGGFPIESYVPSGLISRSTGSATVNTTRVRIITFCTFAIPLEKTRHVFAFLCGRNS